MPHRANEQLERAREKYKESPIALFSLMLRGMAAGNLSLASEAQRGLHEVGFDVVPARDGPIARACH